VKPSAAVVLLSGGLDSAVTLAVARREGCDCHALTIDYAQRHRHELAAAANIARALGAASHRIVPLGLRAIGGSALTDDIPVPRDALPDDVTQRESHIPVTYVPARNMIFLSLAVALAEVLDANNIYIGVNAIDYSGYPDCRIQFISAFEHAACLGTRAGVAGTRFRVHTPLMALTKSDIIRLGASLGVDFSLTTSCYDPLPDATACGHCDACILRRRGFAEAGIPDPTRYASPLPGP
jgi:7-cyano-7-deazaguanine synthase